MFTIENILGANFRSGRAAVHRGDRPRQCDVVAVDAARYAIRHEEVRGDKSPDSPPPTLSRSSASTCTTAARMQSRARQPIASAGFASAAFVRVGNKRKSLSDAEDEDVDIIGIKQITELPVLLIH